MSKQIKCEEKCDRCSATAEWNVANRWITYLWDSEEGEWIEDDSWEGSENSFYCDRCYGKEMRK